MTNKITRKTLASQFVTAVASSVAERARTYANSARTCAEPIDTFLNDENVMTLYGEAAAEFKAVIEARRAKDPTNDQDVDLAKSGKKRDITEEMYWSKEYPQINKFLVETRNALMLSHGADTKGNDGKPLKSNSKVGLSPLRLKLRAWFKNTVTESMWKSGKWKAAAKKLIESAFNEVIQADTDHDQKIFKAAAESLGNAVVGFDISGEAYHPISECLDVLIALAWGQGAWTQKDGTRKLPAQLLGRVKIDELKGIALPPARNKSDATETASEDVNAPEEPGMEFDAGNDDPLINNNPVPDLAEQMAAMQAQMAAMMSKLNG